jgi:hypothetical protein
MVHEDRGPAEGEVHQLATDLFGRRPCLGPLLGHAHEHDAFLGPEVLAVPLDHVVFPLAFLEL